MDEKQMEDLRQLHAAGMRAMSEDEMSARAREQMDGMRNAPAGGDYMRGQAQGFNAWPQMLADEPPRKLTLWQRFRAWCRP